MNHVVPSAEQECLHLRRVETEFISYSEAQEHIAVHGDQIDDFL